MSSLATAAEGGRSGSRPRKIATSTANPSTPGAVWNPRCASSTRSAPRAALDELGNVGQVVRARQCPGERWCDPERPRARRRSHRSSLAAAAPRPHLAARADWLKDRLAFRTAAICGNSTERHSSGLLAAGSSVQSPDNRDLDAVESEFMLASQASTERGRKVQLWTGIGTLVVAIAVLR